MEGHVSQTEVVGFQKHVGITALDTIGMFSHALLTQKLRWILVLQIFAEVSAFRSPPSFGCCSFPPTGGILQRQLRPESEFKCRNGFARARRRSVLWKCRGEVSTSCLPPFSQTQEQGLDERTMETMQDSTRQVCRVRDSECRVAVCHHVAVSDLSLSEIPMRRVSARGGAAVLLRCECALIPKPCRAQRQP